MDEELIKGFKDAGCNGVVFGLETGVESTRMNLLQKRTPNKIYLEVCRDLNKHKMKFINNIMFCLPGETLDHAGRSLVYGLGALLVAPLRLLQDIFNGISQGAAHEKFCDHTN